MAVKGVARGAALIGTPTAVDVSIGGKKLRRGLKLYAVTVGIAKQELYNHLRKQAAVAEDGTTLVYPPGYIHLPKIDAEFLQQLCAEQLVTRRDRISAAWPTPPNSSPRWNVRSRPASSASPSANAPSSTARSTN